jgi:hypothetical protein
MLPTIAKEAKSINENINSFIPLSFVSLGEEPAFFLMKIRKIIIHRFMEKLDIPMITLNNIP